MEDLSLLDESGWSRLIRTLSLNVVLIRVADRFAGCGSDVAPLLDAANAERQRVSAVVKVIARVAELLSARRITFVLTKAFQHYPDMGTDIDILVDDTGLRADHEIVEGLQARVREGTPASVFAGKRFYDVPGSAAPIEIHHARLGLAGEQRSLARRIFRGARRHVVAGISLPIPSPEDQLLLQVVQRIYVHRLIRVSDVVHIDHLLGDQLDLTALHKGAGESGLRESLAHMLRIAKNLAKHGRGLAVDSSRPEPVDGLGYRVGTESALRAFAMTGVNAVARGDLDRAGRIACLPALLMATLAARAHRGWRRRAR